MGHYAVSQQCARTPSPFPTVSIDTVESIDELVADKVHLNNYECQSSIEAYGIEIR